MPRLIHRHAWSVSPTYTDNGHFRCWRTCLTCGMFIETFDGKVIVRLRAK